MPSVCSSAGRERDVNWSPLQNAIFTWITSGSGSANVIARAGTGKTTTLVESASRAKGRTLVCAFNKSIADELDSRVRSNPNATAATLHSVGFSLWRKIRPSSEVDSRKVRSIIKALIPSAQYDKMYCNVLVDAVGFAKGSGFGLPEVGPYQHDQDAGNKLWTDLLDFHDLWDEVPNSISPEHVIEDCAEIYTESIQVAKDEGRIDFNDMLLLPLLFAQGKKYGMYDWVMVDEAQDLSLARRLMVLHVAKEGARIASFGDDRQAIYGFSGASVDSMERLKQATCAIELPLNITYRCPRLIVEMAQQWVPDFAAHESAPEGIIRNIGHADFWLEKLTPQDVILCRNTRPLLGIASRLRDSGIQCVVEGQSGKALIGLATKWGDIEIRDLLMNLEAYREKEVAKWEAKGREDKVEWVQEKVAILCDIAQGMPEDDPVGKLVQKIEFLFGEKRNGEREDVLRLCTVHRAKGREWGRVYLVGRNRYQPSKWAVKEHELAQEHNLEYVAVTRTKRELVEVRVPMPNPKRGVGSGEMDWWELGR